MLTCDVNGNEGMREHTNTPYNDMKDVEEYYIRTKAGEWALNRGDNGEGVQRREGGKNE